MPSELLSTQTALAATVSKVLDKFTAKFFTVFSEVSL
jgi:hypothetical protein